MGGKTLKLRKRLNEVKTEENEKTSLNGLCFLVFKAFILKKKSKFKRFRMRSSLLSSEKC